MGGIWLETFAIYVNEIQKCDLRNLCFFFSLFVRAWDRQVHDQVRLLIGRREPDWVHFQGRLEAAPGVGRLNLWLLGSAGH